MNNNKNKENKNNKDSFFKKIKEMWKDKRGKAKIQLALYLTFFIGVIIFVRITNSMNSNRNDTKESNSFIYKLNDNYEYDINIKINDNTYNYIGTVLGNSSNITKKDTFEYNYKFMNNNYYILDENGNYILTTKEDIYSYFDYKYIDTNYIKKLITLGVKKNNTYIVELNKLILNSTSEEYITITLNEENTSINIDYTNLLKINDENINNFNVEIKYNKINEILSLE